MFEINVQFCTVQYFDDNKYIHMMLQYCSQKTLIHLLKHRNFI